MKTYLSFMKIKFFAEIQYRVAALAGIITQFFFRHDVYTYVRIIF